MITGKLFLASRLIRLSYSRTDRKRNAGFSTPDDIVRFDNILYGNDQKFKKWQLLDVYRPKSAVLADGKLKKLPVIISVHGGSFIYGTKDKYQYYCMWLAEKGFAVVNFSYRLAPETKYPSSVEDTEKVFQWICDNAGQYGFDTSNAFAVGDSAGGHLLAMYTAAITNKDFGKSFSFIKDKNLTLRAIALNCAKYNLSDEDPKVKLLLSGLMPEGGSEEEIRFLDTTTHITKNFPPSFLMTCEGDFVKEEAQTMKKALDAAGVRYEFHCYGDSENPLWHVFHCYLRLKEAVQCNTDECNFFRSFIE